MKNIFIKLGFQEGKLFKLDYIWLIWVQRAKYSLGSLSVYEGIIHLCSQVTWSIVGLKSNDLYYDFDKLNPKCNVGI